VESHTKLSVSQEGLEALRSIPGPVVPVVVIGPYRSGKSFLLNQLLGVGCSEHRTASCVRMLNVYRTFIVYLNANCPTQMHVHAGMHGLTAKAASLQTS
jgi:hypothetical protein